MVGGGRIQYSQSKVGTASSAGVGGKGDGGGTCSIPDGKQHPFRLDGGCFRVWQAAGICHQLFSSPEDEVGFLDMVAPLAPSCLEADGWVQLLTCPVQVTTEHGAALWENVPNGKLGNTQKAGPPAPSRLPCVDVRQRPEALTKPFSDPVFTLGTSFPAWQVAQQPRCWDPIWASRTRGLLKRSPLLHKSRKGMPPLPAVLVSKYSNTK